MMGEERWVGESEVDIPWCLRFQSPEVEERWFVAYLLVGFFFFFCNPAFIVSRYKKPHAALAMERTKPINQKRKHKKVMAPVKYPLSRRFLLRRAIGHI